MQTISCHAKIAWQNDHTYFCYLKAPKIPIYLAGQYCEIKIANEWVPYSIATAPGFNQRLFALHIQNVPNHERNQALLRTLSLESEIEVRLPLGNCHLDFLPEGEVLFCAAGTGLGQSIAMIEDLQARGFVHPVVLWWAVKDPEKDVYFDLGNWAKARKLISCRIVSQHEPIDANGALAAEKIVLSGSFGYVQQAYEQLLALGIKKSVFLSDML